MLFAEGLSAGLAMPLLLAVLAVVGLVGLVAAVWPQMFSSLATRGGHWVDTNAALQKLDQRFDVDAYVLPYARPLGFAVLASVAFLAWFLMRA